MAAKRKIIQISTLRRDTTVYAIFALCDDGTLWRCDDLAIYKWIQISTASITG